jgi:hypothetical protein
MADGVGHCQHGQAEGKRDAMQTDAYVRKRGSEHGAAATTENEPERSKELRTVLSHLPLPS